MLYNNKYKKITAISLTYIILINFIIGINVHAVPVNNLNYILTHRVLDIKTDASVLESIGDNEIAYGKTDYNQPYRNVVFYTAHTTKKLVALTFDDGPDAAFTPKILDILKQNNVKATFFVLGKRAKAHPKIIKRIVCEGHAIGNHSWDHPNLNRLSDKNIYSEIQRTDNTLFYLLGYHPSMVRPPYGNANIRVIKEVGKMGYKIIDWSIDTRDWSGIPPSQITLKIRTKLQPGSIILLHCAGGVGVNLSNTVTALPQIIKELKAQGYKFVRVPELLGISPSL